MNYVTMMSMGCRDCLGTAGGCIQTSSGRVCMLVLVLVLVLVSVLVLVWDVKIVKVLLKAVAKHLQVVSV